MTDKTQGIATGMNNQTGNNGGGNSAKPVASSAPASFAPFFRRRTLGRGRAPSPPTWGCYEQIPLEFTDSEDVDDDDDDEDDEEDEDDNDVETDSDERSVSGSESGFRQNSGGPTSAGYAMEMDMDMEGDPENNNAHVDVDKSGGMDVDGVTRDYAESDAKHTCGSADREQCSDDCGCPMSETQKKKQDKGKQRAVEPVSPTEEKEKSTEKSPKKRQRNGNRSRRRRDRESDHILRPILTIKKSEGFVWNQVCFPQS